MIASRYRHLGGSGGGGRRQAAVRPCVNDGNAILSSIAGGGPVGVVAALALAQQGLAVRVFEAADAVNDSPRASTTHPATLEMLADLGLLDEVVARGLVARTFQFWDRPTGRMVAEFDHAILKNDTPYPFVVQCEQHKLAKMAIERLRKHCRMRRCSFRRASMPSSSSTTGSRSSSRATGARNASPAAI